MYCDVPKIIYMYTCFHLLYLYSVCLYIILFVYIFCCCCILFIHVYVYVVKLIRYFGSNTGMSALLGIETFPECIEN